MMFVACMGRCHVGIGRVGIGVYLNLKVLLLGVRDVEFNCTMATKPGSGLILILVECMGADGQPVSGALLHYCLLYTSPSPRDS